MVFCLTIIAIFLPLFFATYFVVKKIMLSEVGKKILNYGFLACSLFNLTVLTLSYFQKISFEFNFNIINLDKINFNSGLLFNPSTNLHLIFTDVIFLLISVFAILFFRQKKQFMLTKQRFYIFLFFINFICHLTILSSNLFQTLLCWIISSFVILTFSYFDIFKLGADYNPNRYFRVLLTGDFLLLCAALILFKYVIISNGYIKAVSVNFDDFGVLLSYITGICPETELIILFSCLILALMSRFFIFPFNCFFSFISNSSNILYFTLISVLSPVFALDLFIKLNSYFDVVFQNSRYPVVLFAALAALSFFLILFEKNFRIIFGYLLSTINSFLIAAYLYFADFRLIYCCMIVNFALLLTIATILYKNKIGLKRRIINIQKGFIVERAHILFFEKIPYILSNAINFLDERALQFLIKLILSALKVINYYTILKISRHTTLKGLKNIIAIIAVFAFVSALIAILNNFEGVNPCLT